MLARARALAPEGARTSLVTGKSVGVLKLSTACCGPGTGSVVAAMIGSRSAAAVGSPVSTWSC